MRVCSLPSLPIGMRGVILDVDRNAPLADRLAELGFTVGTDVLREYSDRSESLSSYRIADACIALRREDAACVRVRQL